MQEGIVSILCHILQISGIVFHKKQKIMFILYKTGLVPIQLTIQRMYIGIRVWLTMFFLGRHVHQTSI